MADGGTRTRLSSRLRKLLALANRPGTAAEGEQARRLAAELALRAGLTVVETSRGELVALEPDRADLLAALEEIARCGSSRGALPR